MGMSVFTDDNSIRHLAYSETFFDEEFPIQ